MDEPRHALCGLLDPPGGETAVALDVFAEEQVLAALVQGNEARALPAGNKEADGVEPTSTMATFTASSFSNHRRL